MPNRHRMEYRIAWLASMLVDALHGTLLPAARVRVAARLYPDVGAVMRGTAPPPGGVALTIDLDTAGAMPDEPHELANALRRLLDPPHKVSMEGSNIRIAYSAGWPERRAGDPP